jgi:hypothetical protein
MAAKLISNTISPSGTELYHLQFSLQAAIPKSFGHTLVLVPSNISFKPRTS